MKAKVPGQASMRSLNRLQVMEALRANGPVSRVEIGEHTGLAPATVSEITGALLAEDLLRESRSVIAGRGRPRIMLEINADGGRVMGIKLSTHQLTLSLTDLTGRAIAAVSLPLLPQELGIVATADSVAASIRRFLKEQRMAPESLSGIGAGLPGFIETGTGTGSWSPLFGDHPASFSELLEDRLGVPVIVENDVNLVALAERWFGQGKGVDNFCVVTVEHGVGMGMFLDGKLYRGRAGMAAEFGHVRHREHGLPCRCGQLGCIEAYAADYAIVARAAEIVDLGPLDSGRAINAAIREVTRRAKLGDARLRALFADAGHALGLGIANVVNVLTPERVLVTGEGMRAEDLLMRPLIDTFQANTLPFLRETTPLLWHAWTDEVWAQGAAALVLHERFARSAAESAPT
jgi:predicted NBD/HSP70 family sugar kinase